MCHNNIMELDILDRTYKSTGEFEKRMMGIFVAEIFCSVAIYSKINDCLNTNGRRVIFFFFFG